MTEPETEPAHASDLGAIRDAAFRMLARGVADRRSAAHAPTVATTALDGRPGLRTVVLRAFEADIPRMRFHTDRRAAKVAEIAADPRVQMHIYDAGAKVQMRIDGVATCHTGDGVARAAWEASHGFSRLCYMGDMVPGAAHDGPTGGWRDELGDATPDDVDPMRGFGNFVAVRVLVTRLEWLYLAHDGHRRATLDFRDGAVSNASWLVP